MPYRATLPVRSKRGAVQMPGTALGVLLELSAKDDKLPVHIGSILPLFLAWQVTVAAVMGYCIVPRTGDCKPVHQ